MRYAVPLLTTLLIAAGIACLVTVHWLVGLFWLELAIALLAVDRTVGVRYYALADARRSRTQTWPPSRTWTAQVLGAALLGLAIAYVGIRTEEPLAVLAALMAVLAGYLLWSLPLLMRRRRHEFNG